LFRKNCTIHALVFAVFVYLLHKLIKGESLTASSYQNRLLGKLPLIPFHSNIKGTWDALIALMVIASALVIPVRLTFGYAQIDFFYWWITAFFSVDLILVFFTSIKIKVDIIVDHKTIAKTYLKGWFLLDFLSAFPFAPVSILLAGEWITETDWFNFLIILRLIRLIRLLRLSRTLQSLQDSLRINPSVMRLIIFLFWIAMVANLMALGWILIGAVDRSKDVINQYMYALYWAITTLTTVGYGDICPDKNNNYQMAYTILAMFLGAGMYGYVIGNVASLLANIDVARANFLKKMEEITAFLRVKKIPTSIQEKITNYYDYLWETRKSTHTGTILGELPNSLNMEISLFLNKDILERVPLFKNASEIFIREVIQLLEPLVFIPGDYLIRQGEFGDCMYFISSGEIEVLVNDIKVATLGAGAFFGETALIKGEKRNASIRSNTYCDVYRLSKQGFDNLRAIYPEFDRHVTEVVLLREKENAEKLKGKSNGATQR